MSYQEILQNIGDTVERSLVSEFKRFISGEITAAQFIDLGVVLVSTGQAQGRMAAEVALMSWLQATVEATATPVAAAPLAHYQNTQRLEKALGTIVTTGALDAETIERQLGRLAYSETVESSQRAFQEAMRDSLDVAGWTRGLEPNACELCQWWSRDGQVWPVSHIMPTHKGCTCVPVPTKG